MRISNPLKLSILFFCLFSFGCTKTSTQPSSSTTTSNTSGSGSGGSNSSGSGSGSSTNAAGTGGINGTVSPTNLVCQIDAVDALTGLVKATTTSSSKDGSFTISSLTPAKYNVRATPTPDPNNYGIHTWIGAVVSAGAYSTVGPITFQ